MTVECQHVGTLQRAQRLCSSREKGQTDADADADADNHKSTKIAIISIGK